MWSTVPALRSAIASIRQSSLRIPLGKAYISSSTTIRQLQHLHPSEGEGQTLQAPNASSTAADAVQAALGTSKPPVGASSNSTAMGIEELKMKAKKLYKEVGLYSDVQGGG